MPEGNAASAEFFISRAGEDAAFANWLGRLIAAQGKSFILQDQHFGHQNFMGAMDGALKSGARVVGLLSQAYLDSDYCLAEAAAALKGDPLNRQQRLILLRLEPCAPGGVLTNIAFTSLVAERRDSDARPLMLRILRALGFDDPRLDGLPPPPEGTLSASIQVLHPEVQPVPGFAGREDELAAVAQALWSKGGTAALTDTPSPAARGSPPPCGEGLGVGVARTAAVKGLGGVGKSVLAREYAWRSRGRYQGVWWVRSEQRETLLGDLIELGSHFISGLKEVPERDKAARQALAQVEQAGFAKPWLIVHDNVEEPGHIETLTPRSGAHVLITTRWSDWGKMAASVKVGVFPPDVAAQFLLDATGRTDREGAAKLAAALGHLPLALDHAAAYIRRTGIDFATYQKLAADLILKAPKGAAYDTPVYATFSLAIDKAAQTCPVAEKLMGLCAFLAPDGIPLDLFCHPGRRSSDDPGPRAKGADDPENRWTHWDGRFSEIERGEAVAALHEVSLVTLEPLDDGSPGLSVHRLVQAVMHGRLRKGGEHENAAAAATELVADAFPHESEDVRAWPACARLSAHALAVLDHAPEAGAKSARTSLLLNQVAINYVSRAAYAEAEPLMRRALVIDEKSFGSGYPNITVGLNNLAHLLQATSRLAEAEPLMRRALTIDEKSFGSEHPNVAIGLNNLAALLQDTNRLTEAEPLMRRALVIDEKSFGPEHPNVAIRLNNLAQLLQATNRLTKAEPLMRRALTIDEKSLGPEHPNVAIRLNNLARLLKATNRLTEAEPLMRRALAIDERAYGPDHPAVAIGLNNLAALLQDTSRPAEAEPLMRRALAIDDKSFGPEHPNVARDLNNLAQLLRGTGRLAEAEPSVRRAIQILEKFERDTGHSHPNTELFRNNLAALYAKLDERAGRTKPGFLRRLLGRT